MISFKKISLLSVTLLLSIFQIALAAATTTPYFSDVKILDSYTKSTDCTDLNHWFIIQPKITIPAESSTDSIQITIPLAFGSYNAGSFDLMYGSTTVGTVNVEDGSNTLTVSFNTYVTTLKSEIDVEFNILAKFSDTAKELVNKPMSLSYVVNASDDKTFQPTINFIGTDLSTITTNGGFYSTNGTAWFVINVPISSLNGALTIEVKPTGTNSFYYDPNFTNLQVVTAVDEFNNPTASVPFTAYKDESTTASLLFNLTSNISGGKYLRIAYTSGPLMYDAITNEVTINGKTNLDNTVYTDSVTNVELNSASAITGLDMNLLFSNITTAATTTSTSTPVTIVSQESSTSSDVSSDDFLLSPEAETLDLSTEEDTTNSTTTSSAIISTISTDILTPSSTTSVSVVTSSQIVSKSTTDESSITTSSSLTTATTHASIYADAKSINGTVISTTSSTTSPFDYNSNMTVSTTRTAADNDTYETYTVLKSTSSAQVTEITKLVPIATLSGTTVSSEIVVTSTIDSNNGIDADERFVNSTSSAISSTTFTTSNPMTIPTTTNTTSSSGVSNITSTRLSTQVITTTSCSKNVCYLTTSTIVSKGYVVTTESHSEDATVKTNLVPVSTLACSTCVKSETVKSKGYIVNSETQAAKATTNTKLVPIATLTSSTTTTTKNNVAAEHKTTTLTAAVDETIVSYTTKSCSTTKIANSVSVGAAYVETRETQSASVTSYLNFLGGYAISKSSTPTTTQSTVEILIQSTKPANHTSSYTLSMYEAGSSQLTIGLGTFIVGLFTLLL